MSELLPLLVILAAIGLGIWYGRTRKMKPRIGEMLSVELVRYAAVEEIDSVDWKLYSTCRGSEPKSVHLRILDIVGGCNESATEDAYSDAVNDGLWDWYCHQYTLYSISPIVLDHILKSMQSGKYAWSRDLIQFVEVCSNGGDRAVWLTQAEIAKNLAGQLPLFGIKDVLARYPCTEKILAEAKKLNEGRG